MTALLNSQELRLVLTSDQYSNLHIVKASSPYFYSSSWPSFTNSTGKYSFLLTYDNSTSSISTDSVSLFLIVHGTLKVYRLLYNVFPPSAILSTVRRTFFGINQCVSGQTGRNCSITACPNSLIINSVNTLSSVIVECSGHGSCTASGCQCEANWGGDDCSVYTPRSCSGNYSSSYPLNNCECHNTTIGGNSCDIIFCPNDCTGHGTCQQGFCHCSANYLGADCSIMVINFP